MGRRRVSRRWVGVAGALMMLGSGAFTVVASQGSASADASGPPALGALRNCPKVDYPPPGYPLNGTFHPDHSGPQGSGTNGFEVPFVGTIGSRSDAGGQVVVPSSNPATPSLIIPHLYGVLCGLVYLPTLSGAINGNAPGNIVLGPANVYIGASPQVAPGGPGTGGEAFPNAIEALPLGITFGKLVPNVVKTPAHNGGLDVTLDGSTTAVLNTDGSAQTPAQANVLGMRCPLTLQIPLSTVTTATVNGVPVAGQPVTGPIKHGVAQVVSDSFALPAVATSPTCPPAIALAQNRFLGLPLPPGRATFVAPISFCFELQATKTGPMSTPQANCPSLEK